MDGVWRFLSGEARNLHGASKQQGDAKTASVHERVKALESATAAAARARRTARARAAADPEHYGLGAGRGRRAAQDVYGAQGRVFEWASP